MSNSRMTSKRILVTGSTAGLGKILAQTFAEQGAYVGINGRNRERVLQVVQEHENFFDAYADLTVPQEVMELAQFLKVEHGHLDGLILNAGGGKPDFAIPVPSEWKRVLDLNLFSAVNSIEYLAPLLKNGFARVIFIGSIAGSPNVDAPSPYSVAKQALGAFARETAISLSPRNIPVYFLKLGNLIFGGSTWEAKLEADRLGTERYIEERVPLKRFGTPSDVSEWCEFLLCCDSSFATGAMITIDGGQTL